MALTIRALRNHFSTNANPYYAHASWSQVVETEAFIDRMASGRTTISKIEILAVFQLAIHEPRLIRMDGLRCLHFRVQRLMAGFHGLAGHLAAGLH